MARDEPTTPLPPEGLEETDTPPWHRQPTVVLPVLVVAIGLVVGAIALLTGQPEELPEAGAPAEVDELQPDPETEPDPEAADPDALVPDPGVDPPPDPDVDDADDDAEPAPQTFSGEADATETFDHTGGLARFDIVHHGDGAFAATLDGETLSDAEGGYTGSRVMGLSAGEHELEVTAGAPWEITVTQPRPTMGVALPAQFSGDTDTATEPIAHEGGAMTLTVSYEGDDDMVLVLWSADGVESLGLIDESGPFEDREAPVRLPEGVVVADVVADGEWRILVE